jgi:glucokinase
MTYTIGIDLGGTKIAGVLTDTSGEQIVTRRTIPTESKLGPDAVMDRIAENCRALCEQAGITLDQVRAVGLGVPGVVNYDEGMTILIPNLPGDWYRRPVESQLESRLGRPVRLINDARAFTLAEANLGAGKGYPVVACMTLGTGIGGGVAINGRLHMGMGYSAGEFGHMTIDINGLPDGSGTPGAIEGISSGPSIAAAGIKAVIQGVNTRIGELVDYDLKQITPRTVLQAAEMGDDVAKDILRRVGLALGASIANVVIVLSPHCFVLGGGVSSLGDAIINPIREGLQIYCRTVEVDKMALVTAALGDDAGALGAALWAYQRSE